MRDLKAPQSSQSEPFTPLAEDLPGRVQSGRDETVGQAFICEENDLGADHIQYDDVYLRALESSSRRSSSERFLAYGAFSWHQSREPLDVQGTDLTSLIRD